MGRAGRPTVAIELSDDERETLRRWARRHKSSQALALRCRIVLAAARELAGQRITANVVNPGPVDTGWMTSAQLSDAALASPRGRVGRPTDTAALVAFLASDEAAYISGQVISINGAMA